MYTIKDLYDLDHTLAADYLAKFTYPWEALGGIKEMILVVTDRMLSISLSGHRRNL